MAVQVWFHCDAPGCEARAERLVQIMPHTGSVMVMHADQVPDGWLNITSATHDRTGNKTLCPEHAFLKPQKCRAPFEFEHHGGMSSTHYCQLDEGHPGDHR